MILHPGGKLGLRDLPRLEVLGFAGLAPSWACCVQFLGEFGINLKRLDLTKRLGVFCEVCLASWSA